VTNLRRRGVYSRPCFSAYFVVVWCCSYVVAGDWFGVVITALVTSTKLSYVEPG